MREARVWPAEGVTKDEVRRLRERGSRSRLVPGPAGERNGWAAVELWRLHGAGLRGAACC